MTYLSRNILEGLRQPRAPEPFSDRFVIEREAGIGGMGIVYRAFDRLAGEPVALKVLRRTDADAVERFSSEAAALEKIRHPRVVRYVAHGMGSQGEPFLAMEWVEGESLHARLARGCLAVHEAVELGCRMAEALAALHAVGILHRDVKPSNVLLPDGRIDRAKVVDFGIARVKGRAAFSATASGIIIGSPGYIAPEQARGMRDLDLRVDLFALGCVLYRCLTDTDAFGGSVPLTALAKLALLEPLRVAELRRDVPAALDELIASLLAKDRELRPASADIVQQRLEHIARDLRAVRPRPRVDRSDASSGCGPAPGAVFGRYLVERRINSDGMSELFSAHDMTLGRRVVLKVLRTRSAGALTGTARVLMEARAVAAVSHPNIVAIHDVSEHQGLPFLVMEYLTGHTLRACVGANEPSAEQRMSWLVDAATGLQAAHRAGLIHADIKPENVMLTDEGTVKLLDFGLARAAQRGAAQPSEEVIGTLAYLAPEQVRGERLDACADQFAWAVMAYEVLLGRLPWSAADALSILACILSEEPDFATLPPQIAPVIARAMCKEPTARFDSMDELVNALGWNTPPARPSLDRAKWPRRRWKAGFALVLVAGLASVALSRSATTRHQRDAPALVRPTTLVSLAAASTCAPAATALYGEGLRALREANWRQALTHFEQAYQQDASCPQVRLRLVTSSQWLWPIHRQREELGGALALRDALSERDQLLLDAWKAIVGPEAPDERAAADILQHAVSRFPDDAELVKLLAARRLYIVATRDELEQSLALARRATSLDSDYADAWLLQADLLARLDRADDAMAAVDRCLEVAPGSAVCRETRIRFLRKRGQCGEAAAEARRWMTWEPQQARPYYFLALSLTAQGSSRHSVEEALNMHFTRLSEDRREPVRLHHLSMVETWSGHFQNALGLAAKLEQRVSGASGSKDHLRAAMTIIETLLEIGEREQAAIAAERTYLRQQAWVKGDLILLGEEYFESLMLAVLLAQNRVSPDEWRKASDQWEQSARKHMDASDVWALRWGTLAAVGLDVTQASQERPPESEGAPQTPHRAFQQGTIEAYRGRLLLQLGDAPHAIPLLEAAARSCQGLDGPFLSVSAYSWLAMAREQSGDLPAACAAYAVVEARWGAANTASVSARTAQQKRRELRCSAP
ncbi:MAG TPA: protein kinase [Polyangiaceae bacterium]|nr:protein kinase [Polyangiaceae bacterium]